MAKIVIKFGGTSVGSIEKIVSAAKIVKNKLGKGNKIIVVVSAMAGKTNELVKQSEKISKKFKNFRYWLWWWVNKRTNDKIRR